MNKVYLVEDCTGRTLAIFDDEQDAIDFADMVDMAFDAIVIERTVFQGQPPVRGYNG